MGHIDHGKSKILETIRKTAMLDKESGGITQHIGAYEVLHNGEKITFIDTPGHEAFTKLRARGAKIADIAILVVASDEGVKPQTREALDIIQKHNLPFVVALNKIDKPEANPERVKGELAELGILVESYGGKVPSVEISAKTGEKIDELLEIILLVAELENLSADPYALAEGEVIEVNLNPQRGITATLIVLDGTLKKGDVAAIGRSVETIKILEDFKGQSIEEAGPSKPVLISGLKEMPDAGDTFRAFPSKKEAEKFIETLPPREPVLPKKISKEMSEKPIFNLIIKADAVGSKEALESSFKKLESDAIGINILKSETGDIGESDMKLAMATNLVTIIGFKVKIDSVAREMIEQSGVRVVTGEVIYEILDEVKKKIEEMIPPEIKRIDLGRAKILKFFKKDGSRQILGGRVEEGIIKKGAKIQINRLKENVGSGSILELQREKQPVTEVIKGFEFGAMIDSRTEIQEGDVIEIFEEEVIKRTL
jgi:translation initiation factor IF-2